jgi:hypothetical protein
MQLYRLDDTWDLFRFSETYTFYFWAGPQVPVGLEAFETFRMACAAWRLLVDKAA